MPSEPTLPFDNSYERLPEHFYTRQPPEPVPAPELIRLNRELATALGLNANWLASEAGINMLAGNHVPEGASSIATVYAGHQFGNWNPQLGDGRALLLGEVVGSDGIRYDIQLKGSGRTPYSRGGDGKSPLGPVLREYIVSEAMAALGVPTTRALAAVSSGEQVVRDRLLPGAILTRVAQSHIRIGTVQFFASRGDVDALRALIDHVIDRHYPEAREADNPVRALLDGVIANQARLVARWQLLGFIHGVMNTDNMLLSGETIDYGPCAFMDRYHPGTVFSSIDHGGRYAYGNQPAIAHWNLAALAQALLPLLSDDQEQAVELAQKAVDAFPELFLSAYRAGMADKLGLESVREEDEALAQGLLTLMEQESLDFTLTFRRLAELAGEHEPATNVSALCPLPESLEPWLQRWRQRLASDTRTPEARQAAMLAANPVFIPRNHLVEEAIAAAQNEGDYAPFHALVERLSRPCDYHLDDIRYATPPQPEQVVTQTFCGT